MNPIDQLHLISCIIVTAESIVKKSKNKKKSHKKNTEFTETN